MGAPRFTHGSLLPLSLSRARTRFCVSGGFLFFLLLAFSRRATLLFSSWIGRWSNRTPFFPPYRDARDARERPRRRRRRTITRSWPPSSPKPPSTADAKPPTNTPHDSRPARPLAAEEQGCVAAGHERAPSRAGAEAEMLAEHERERGGGGFRVPGSGARGPGRRVRVARREGGDGRNGRWDDEGALGWKSGWFGLVWGA